MDIQNYNPNDFNELDDLRQQINAIKNKVDEQGHLNEELVKKAIQGKMKGVHRTLMLLAVAVIFCIPLYIWMKYEENLSWPLIIFTIIIMIGSLISDYFINRINISHMGDDLVETARKLTKMKKDRNLGRTIGMSVAGVWLVWFIYEFYHSHLIYGETEAWLSIIPLLVGAIIGLAVGLRIFSKMQRANDEMIEQINDLTRGQ